MAPRQKKDKFQQLTEFEQVRVIGLREGVFSYHVVGACVQWHSSAVMRVWKQWTDEHRTTRKTGRGRRKVTSAYKDRHLHRMAVNDHTVSSRQLTAHWPNDTDESRFNLWDHDGRILVRRYAGERYLPDCVIEQHSGLTHGVKACGVISYHGRSNLLGIEGNLNSDRYVREVLQPEVVLFFQGIPGAIFQQSIAHTHMLQRLFNTSVQPNIYNVFLGLFFAGYVVYLTRLGFG
ncbi:transposable element Tc1 transposase [Trichonephila clavipes]|nr:transposable element Tc1 transposase [Trichonephila clavipes]